jgi:hypothetical protein
MTKYKKYDQDRVSAVVVGVGALPVRVHPDQAGDLDLQHQRPVHRKFQGPAHKVLRLPRQQIHIKIDYFQLKNIGMDQNYGAKYFLDLDFTLDTTINREKLKSMYIREITSLFKSYIVNTRSNNYALDSQRERTNLYKNVKETSQKNSREVRKVVKV